jgi:arginase
MQVHIVAVPFDTAIRGWRMGAGPEHLLANGLVARLAERGHSVTTAILAPKHGAAAEIATAFELMALVAGEVRRARAANMFPLILSGNCCTAPGTLAGLTPGRRAVFWFDAHGDANTPETTVSGFLDGTALATAMGWCWRGLTAQIPGFQPVESQHVRLIGTRDLDREEAALLEHHGVRTISPGDIAGPVLDEALSAFSGEFSAYLHCDLDVLDPSVGQANVFPVPGGIDVEQIVQAIQLIARSMPIAAAAVTAYAPEYDTDGGVRQAAFRVIDAVLDASNRTRP